MLEYGTIAGVFLIEGITMHTYIVRKALNNNVLTAYNDRHEEVILIGKGIGFHYKKEDTIHENVVEKLFVLRNEKEQAHYKELLSYIDEQTLNTIIASTELIRKRSKALLNEHVHVALTDHLVFAINRLSKGLAIKNPFLSETKVLYPFEYEIAAEVVDLVNQSIGINLPEGEIGFIALHVHSAIVNKNISEVNKYSQLVTAIIDMIEKRLDITIDRDTIDYIRLLRHIRYTIERVASGDKLEEPGKIAELLKQEYPLYYNLAWQLIKVMQKTLNKPVYDAEAVYLTMHLQRLDNKHK